MSRLKFELWEDKTKEVTCFKILEQELASCYKKGSGILFTASNGIVIASSATPELRIQDGFIYLRGNFYINDFNISYLNTTLFPYEKVLSLALPALKQYILGLTDDQFLKPLKDGKTYILDSTEYPGKE
jgi:hypothetical protein